VCSTLPYNFQFHSSREEKQCPQGLLSGFPRIAGFWPIAPAAKSPIETFQNFCIFAA
jgi:hypothetical protein